jgi:hypothetical protein
MPVDRCVVKLDFLNAFKSLHRYATLNALLEKAPGIYKFCHLSYSKPSVLVYNGHTIQSRERSQQGDPLGALLYRCTIQQLLLSLVSELTLGYMDDVTLDGPVSQLAQDVDTIRRKGKEVGLQLNDKKCELIFKVALPNNPIFENFIRVHMTLNFLGLR